jgi:uncharacterized protein (DUF111 family)
VQTCERAALPRAFETVGTPWGRVAVKYAAAGGTLVSVTPEFEDCAAAATAAGVPLKTVADAARHAFFMNFVEG